MKSLSILEDQIRYIPEITKTAHHGQPEGTLTKKAYAGDTYKGHMVAEFNVKLTNNQYLTFHNVPLVLPMKIKKAQIMQLILTQR